MLPRLGALRKSGKLDNGFYVDAGFSTGARLYGALSRDVAAKSNERSVALLGAVFKAHVAKKLRLGGARVLRWFDAILRSYDLGLAKFLGPAYAARETDAFSKHVALAFADGARLKTLLYHFVGDARGLEDGPGARRAAAFGRAAADAAVVAGDAAAARYEARVAALDADACAAALDDVLAVARALRAPVLFGSGRGLADALTTAGGDAPAAAARLDFALLQLRELHDCLKDRQPRGSPHALKMLRSLPPPKKPPPGNHPPPRAAPRAAAPAPPPPATPPRPAARATPLRSGTKPPWALGAE